MSKVMRHFRRFAQSWRAVRMIDPVTGSIIASAASSLLGGLFGKKNKTSQSVDLKKLVSDAQQAGFNPLTVLQSTGGTGWGSQVTANDFNPLAAAAAGAAQGFGDYWAQSKDRELLDAQIDLAKAQAGNIRSGASQATFSGVRDMSGSSVSSQVTPTDVTVNRSPTMLGDQTVNNSQGDPAELETEAWGAAVRGEIFPWLKEVWWKNATEGGPDYEQELQWARRKATADRDARAVAASTKSTNKKFGSIFRSHKYDGPEALWNPAFN
ncbi:MAG: hypothetical protein [Microviridae sp.]|nr:MAG: hypothetical protein [Microviridae sp.]